MGKRKQLGIKRLKEILRRQDPPGRGRDYIPAIRAERTEAPGRSRPSRVWSPKLGREIHVLSLVEQRALWLALYHPDLIDLHEQRMLAVEPRPHPLEGHPAVTDEHLPPFQGTIAVASRLGSIRHHPFVTMRTDDGDSVKVPYPFIGDLLLFLVDAAGPYCVNWTIKLDSQGFHRRAGGSKPVRDPEQAEAKARIRHAIEEIYYRDAGIPTIRVVRRDIPDALEGNLRRLYSSFSTRVDLDDDARSAVIDRLQGCLLTGQPPLEAFLVLRGQLDLDIMQLKALMEQAIWNRALRVDLFEGPVFCDKPLVPERTDVLDQYATWFNRGAA
ncbi:MAG: hypothetical protein H6953_05920 [Chromatiaceae bacterium]|nr:hypothetical protein [Chromatiaceae bacterium]MCP5314921.1 hypothetical protein [Chromatiaceae bacterium]